MEAKEKAKDLHYKFYNADCDGCHLDGMISGRMAKQCALICVDEIMDSNNYIMNITGDWHSERVKYWNEVKNELDKL